MGKRGGIPRQHAKGNEEEESKEMIRNLDSWYDPPEETPRMFEIEYDTEPSPGATYYHGTRKIEASDSGEAADMVQRMIARNFPEYGSGAINHIRIRSVKEIK